MSFFTVNHGEAKNPFEPIKPGKYEVVITETEVKPALTGNMMIRTVYTIREDVDQPSGKRKLFDNLVAADNEFCQKKFQQVAKAIGLPEGASVGSIEEFAQQMMFKPVKLTVTNKNEVYQGETRVRENISFIDEPGVPYSGGGGSTGNAFDVSYGEFPSDFPAEENDADETPPWEQPPADDDKPKKGRSKPKNQDPFADDGKPIDISDDDLPF